MSMAGIKCDDSVVKNFEEMKMGKKTRHCTFKLSDDNKTITFDAKSDKTDSVEADWKVFSDYLLSGVGGEPRYACFDFEWAAADGHSCSKLLFVMWVPDTAKIKPKMLYGSSKDAIKKALIGIGNDLQATDASELTYECALDKCKSGVRIQLRPRDNRE